MFRIRHFSGAVLAAAFLADPLAAHAQATLQQQIAVISADAHGTVSVACALPGTALNCDQNPHAHSPMQSMFKLPLAITVLHLAVTGKLPGQRAGEPLDTTLARNVRFLPEDRISGSYSPLTDKYPQANVDIALRELLQRAAGESDNGATETLLRIIGGPAVVDSYMHAIGVTAFHLEDGERGLHNDPTAQYRNWIEPAAAVQLLELVASHSPLSPAATAFLVQVMTASATGEDRLRAGLPPGTKLAHKTGSSGMENGVAAATNDVGLITLPDGRQVALAVFVTDAKAGDDARSAVIARIGHAVYEAALHTH